MENKNEKVALNEEVLDKVAGGGDWHNPEYLSDPDDDKYKSVIQRICPRCGTYMDYMSGKYLCLCGECYVLCS